MSEDPGGTDEADIISHKEAWKYFLDGPQDVFTCESCGERAHRGNPAEMTGALYAEVDNKPTIVCVECDDKFDWETVESKIRNRRSGKREIPLLGPLAWLKSTLRPVTDRIPVPLPSVSLPGEPVESAELNQFGQLDDYHREGDGRSETDQTSLTREQELRQTHEWASYLESELNDREEQMQELEARLARVQQELKHARESQSGEDAGSDEREALLTDLFDIRDNFRRALDAEAIIEDETAGEFRESIELVDRQIKSVLEREGVTEIDTSGEVDPTRHRVVNTEPTTAAAPGEIVDVYQLGYRQDERVLREAHVVVAERPDVEFEDGQARSDRGGDPE